MPILLVVSGGGHNFFERTALLAGQLGQINYLVFALGVVAILLLVLGERACPARPVGLAVVGLSVVVASVFGLPALGVRATGEVPAGALFLVLPGAGLRDADGILAIADGG